jgi:putative intracellular protease/amidase
MQLEDIKVLALIADGFGDPYFYAKEQLESWGCNFTTAGLTDVSASCPNKPQRPVTCDILISEIDQDIISDFDCMFIPPGASHLYLQSDQDTLELIAMAYDEGLVIATMCVSLVVLARANGITSGVNVVTHNNANYDFQEAGAIIRGDARIISDSRIITANRLPGVSLSVLTYQVCKIIAKEALSFSYVHKTTLESASGDSGTEYTVNVEIIDWAETLIPGNVTEIAKVTAYIRSDTNSSFTKTVELTEGDQENIYSGNFTELNDGSYRIKIEVKDSNGTLEVARNEVRFSVGKESSPGFEFIIALASIAMATSLHIRRRAKNRTCKKL